MPDVTITGATARQRFNGCDPAFIRDVCRARCCDAPSRPTGTLITILPIEQANIERRGGVVVDGLLQPRGGEHVCRFKDPETFLCGLHHTPDKPFGCIASPFTLSPTGSKLIVRNRYRLLPCYNVGPRLPAYVAFRASLDLLFGTAESARLCRELDEGADQVVGGMAPGVYAHLRDADSIKKGRTATGSQSRPS